MSWVPQDRRSVFVALGLAQLALLGVFIFEPLGAIALALGALGAVLVVDRPLAGVALLLVTRLVGTGATVFFRVGKIGVGPYELALVLCVFALGVKALARGHDLWPSWPWKRAFLALMGWMVISLGWSLDKGDGISEILPLILVTANTIVILTFVRSAEQVRMMLRVWLGACVLIGLLTAFTNVMGISVGSVSFQAAAGGGRETGLGQQPNWFAMNLFFIVPTGFGLAVIEKRPALRLAALAATLFVLFTMLGAGSRGGAYASLIGTGLAALGHARFRRWVAGISALVSAMFVGALIFDVGGLARALGRVTMGLTIPQNYRPWNWMACVEMFLDTKGLGIGVGGYSELLPSYNYLLSTTQYDYPHGIFWQIIAHLGAVGLILTAWLIVSVARMAVATIRDAKGRDERVIALTIPAALLGYAAWSFFEFTLVEKPFWELLALLTALHLALKREAEG